MAKVIIPTALRQYAGQRDEVELAGGTVGDVLNDLTAQYPELRRQLYTEDDRLRNYVNVYLNDEDVRYLKNTDTKVRDGDTIYIIPAIAGGAVDVAGPPAAAGLNGATSVDEVELSHEEIRRYSRHLIVPEVGRWMPAINLSSVDLPDPLCPISP